MAQAKKTRVTFVTKDSQGNKIKRNFNNVKAGIQDSELIQASSSLNSLLANETPQEFDLSRSSVVDL